MAVLIWAKEPSVIKVNEEKVKSEKLFIPDEDEFHDDIHEIILKNESDAIEEIESTGRRKDAYETDYEPEPSYEPDYRDEEPYEPEPEPEKELSPDRLRKAQRKGTEGAYSQQLPRSWTGWR